MTIKFSDQDQTITAYTYDENMIYNCSFQYSWIKGTGLAAKSTNIKPPTIPKGKVAVFDIETDQWTIQSDFRGLDVYNIETQARMKVENVGSIEQGFTLLKPNSIYDTWDGKKWINKRSNQQKITDEILVLPALTKRQFRLGLVNNGFNLSKIEQTISSIEDDLQRQTVQIEWEDAQTFERTSSSLKLMSELLGLDDEQVNNLWHQAMTL